MFPDWMCCYYTMVAPERLQEEDEYDAPRDKGNLVYFCVMLVGFGVLMPWNMFMTIAPEYYIDYWFTVNGTKTDFASNFFYASAIASQFPNASINLINLIIVISGPLVLRVAAPIVFNLLSVLTVLFLIIFVYPTTTAMPFFFWGTLLIIALINISNGLYENSVFGVFADFPHKYTSALLVGNNLCGLVVTVITIIINIFVNDDPRLTAIIYFSISLGILTLCGIALYTIINQKFYTYYHEKGLLERQKAATEKPSFAILLQAANNSKLQLFNVWFTFAVTLCIFPAMMGSTERPKIPSVLDEFIPDHMYVIITTYLVFNVFSTVGAAVASWIQWPSPSHLWIPVTLRGLFVAYFFFSNYESEKRTFPVYFDSTEGFIMMGALMAFSAGYLSSCAMSYAPRVVNPHLARFAAQFSAFFLMFGLLSGGIISFFISRIVSI